MELFYGILGSRPAAAVASFLAVACILGYSRARLWLWTVAAALMLWLLGAPPWSWLAYAAVALTFHVPALRRLLVSGPLMKGLARSGLAPSISQTERVALESGTTWIESEFISGNPDFGKILRERYPELSGRERAFLDGPVVEVCRMTDDWETHESGDLPREVWDYLKQAGFFGMAIPQEYGGHGFSTTAMNAVVGKLASRSVPLAVTVMVPNSLGPGELLVHYGTVEQKDHYLPRLAAGADIPCFALTEADAGSDAASIGSWGEVFRGDDGALCIRLNWKKRYITLAPVSTVLGLAFRLRDPQNLLGKGHEPGITCALVPADSEGVVLGRRHNPLGVPFVNGPTEGRDVVVSADQIIGGAEQAGNGWRMLMETLAAGRGIFLPGFSTGNAKLTSRVTGAYARVRQQFGLPIGKFEGVVELLAPIGGLTYLMQALSRFTCGALDRGARPAVVSAIAKCYATEFNRVIVNHGMDILGGAGIVLGPRNLLGHRYQAVPVGITVEGSNVVTRSLIIFGQGLFRGHRYALEELRSLEAGEVTSFDRALGGHLRQVTASFFRALLLGLSHGRLATAPVNGPTAKYYRKLSWASATFSLCADVALLTLGGDLKRREGISARFADILSWLYLGTAALRRFEAEGRKEEDLPFVHWTLQHGLFRIQQAFEGIFENFPIPVVRQLLRGPLAWCTRIHRIGLAPSDAQQAAVADAMQRAGDRRDRLTEGIFLPSDPHESLAKLERALDLTAESEEPVKRLRAAAKAGRLPKARQGKLIEEALKRDVIDAGEYRLLSMLEAARSKAVQVDAFALSDMPVNAGSSSCPRLLPWAANR